MRAERLHILYISRVLVVSMREYIILYVFINKRLENQFNENVNTLAKKIQFTKLSLVESYYYIIIIIIIIYAYRSSATIIIALYRGSLS